MLRSEIFILYKEDVSKIDWKIKNRLENIANAKIRFRNCTTFNAIFNTLFH